MSGLRTGCVRTAAWLVLACAASPASGHDFWIEPSTYRPRLGQPVGVALRAGDHFQGRPVPRNAERIVKFVSVGPESEKPIPGRDGSDPAGLVRFVRPGTHVLAYRSNRAFTEMEAVKFERYLEEKGLDKVIERRKQLGPSDTKTREAFSRCSKSLVRVGEPTGEDGDRSIGLTMEIIAESNPYEMAAGSELAFRLAYEGEPLQGALVTAMRRGAGDRTLSARTDPEGRVRFVLGEAGTWLIASVHMIEAPKGVDAEWESFWASLTFELPTDPDPRGGLVPGAGPVDRSEGRAMRSGSWQPPDQPPSAAVPGELRCAPTGRSSVPAARTAVGTASGTRKEMPRVGRTAETRSGILRWDQAGLPIPRTRQRRLAAGARRMAAERAMAARYPEPLQPANSSTATPPISEPAIRTPPSTV